MEGQMWDAERQFLYSAILSRAPSVVLEVGTWKGGGSTLQIASALHEIHSKLASQPILYTCETDINNFTSAVNGFKNQPTNKFIKFHNIQSTELIKSMIADSILPDFVFFDGPEDPKLNLDDFKLLDQHLASGTFFCMHDWDLGVRADGCVSTKAQLLRPYLENLSSWRIIDTLTAPVSVGIVLAVKQ